jgi:hypothetical protein
MEAKEYNGWTNYETWAVNLWLDNEQGSHYYWRSAARNAIRRAQVEPVPSYLTAQEYAWMKLADELKESITDSAPDLGASMFSDLLSAALSEVDWREIAIAMLDELDEYKALAQVTA